MHVNNNLSIIELNDSLFYHSGLDYNDSLIDISFFDEGYHIGQFAFVNKINDGLYKAVRDPLGIGKMFYTETPEGDLFFSEKYGDLFSYGSRIYSLPAGDLVLIGKGGQREFIRSVGLPWEVNSSYSPESFYNANSIDAQKFYDICNRRMNKVFSSFRKLEEEGWTFLIALSGGLDSSFIASKASEKLKHPIACTLDLGNSEDSEKSIKIASLLGIEHLVFNTDKNEILCSLEKAPLLAQDYRDFNVHCAVLNLILGKKISEYIKKRKEINRDKVVILTGDLMNEYTCDYSEETIDGVEYYRLPRVGRKELQNYLIGGLDTSDRELSPFREYGLVCIQPYAMLYDQYRNLPESLLAIADSKKLINSQFVDPALLDLIPKEKLRAQVGSRDNMGILGLCHEHKIGEKDFLRTFQSKWGIDKSQIPIFVGRYDLEKIKRSN